jgi:hypothetical protein
MKIGGFSGLALVEEKRKKAGLGQRWMLSFETI